MGFKFAAVVHLVLMITLTNSQLESEKNLLCDFCHKLQTNSIELSESHFETIINIGTKVCQLKASKILCNYFVKTFGRGLLQKKIGFFQKTDFLCSNFLHLCPKKFEEFKIEDFLQKIRDKYPAKVNAPTKSSKPFVAVVLNDIHLQLDYEHKSESQCGEVGGCCSGTYGFPTDPKRQAGYWGTAHAICDVPERTLNGTMKFIKENMPSPDFVFMLGDNVSHNYFSKNESEIVATTRIILERIKQDLPNAVIIPVVGNHECHFVDNLDYDDQQNWVYENIYPVYEEFISKEKIADLKNNSFYTIENSEFNIKVISMNSQFYDGFNAFNIGQSEVIWEFLDRLADAIYQSEKTGQKVILLTHIPLAEFQTFDEINQSFKAILERFQSTIIGFFSAHTHYDQIKFLKNSKKEVFMANYISPSLTTNCVNPSFRIYYFGDNRLINYEQHSFDLEVHNKLAEQGNLDLRFYKAYDFLSEYGLKDLSNESLAGLEKRFSDRDEATMTLYVGHHNCAHKTKDFSRNVDNLLCYTHDNIKDLYRCLQKQTKEGLVGKMADLIFQKAFYHKMLVSPTRTENLTA